MDFSYAWSIRDRLVSETLDTLYMMFFSAIVAGIIGIILGVLLVTTKKGGLLEAPLFNNLLDKVLNLLRAVPFIILIAVIAPLTILIMRTRIGTNAALVPLIFTAAPYFAKQIEQALSSIDPGLIEAAVAMGESPFHIITSVYLKEGLPQIVRASAITLISLLGLTAMAGTVGAGGIGELTISLGYNRYKTDVTLVSLAIILILVFSIQAISNFIIRKISH